MSQSSGAHWESQLTDGTSEEWVHASAHPPRVTRYVGAVEKVLEA